MLARSTARTPDSLSGVLYGIAAYGWWGFAAIYFKAVASVSPMEILAHRIVWSIAILLLLVTLLKRWPVMRSIAGSRRSVGWLALSTVLIAVNWYTFIWAVTSNHILDASLGYFINPLVSVLFGVLFFRERLRRRELASVALAATAVAWLTISAGVVPWIALVLAVSFGLYGLVRKLAAVPSIEALTVETALLFPAALVYLLLRARAGTAAWGESLTLDLLLVAAGPVTALPLLWFASAVSRLRLATVGLLQYLAPTMQFLLAVLVYGEPFQGAKIFAFILIWIAVAIYSSGSLRTSAGRAET